MMKYTDLKIPGIFLIEPEIFPDNRGFFMETWRENNFKEKVGDFSFVQENHSKSKRGILRGLHYQIQHAQGKLVRVTSGEVFDVAVDLRKSSKTFGKWLGINLSASNKKILWIPPGFAHGYLVLSDSAEFVYKCTNYYTPDHERCIKWDDPVIGIEWPQIPEKGPILSLKDKVGVLFEKAEVYS